MLDSARRACPTSTHGHRARPTTTTHKRRPNALHPFRGSRISPRGRSERRRSTAGSRTSCNARRQVHRDAEAIELERPVLQISQDDQTSFRVSLGSPTCWKRLAATARQARHLLPTRPTRRVRVVLQQLLPLEECQRSLRFHGRGGCASRLAIASITSHAEGGAASRLGSSPRPRGPKGALRPASLARPSRQTRAAAPSR